MGEVPRVRGGCLQGRSLTGSNHEKLPFCHAGRNLLSDVHGKVVFPLLA